MKQRSIALTSLVGGVVGFGLAGMIQLDRTLLTTPQPLPAAPREARILPARTENTEKPAAVENKLPDVQVLRLEPIFITGTKNTRLELPAQASSFKPRPSAPVAAALVVPDT